MIERGAIVLAYGFIKECLKNKVYSFEIIKKVYYKLDIVFLVKDHVFLHVALKCIYSGTSVLLPLLSSGRAISLFVGYVDFIDKITYFACVCARVCHGQSIGRTPGFDRNSHNHTHTQCALVK